MSNSEKNDNEKRGLPRDIDLLATATNLLISNPGDIRRVENLLNIIDRVRPQIEDKKAELTALSSINPA